MWQTLQSKFRPIVKRVEIYGQHQLKFYDILAFGEPSPPQNVKLFVLIFLRQNQTTQHIHSLTHGGVW